ncbi:MAG TPA: flagellar hook protein FlgE [Steroidobacteraceae bacterium]|nr:flagellar hook protein FlgE [Gammaproteobacteria bacterium]HEV2286311.1 flagellar hook protein FlgE [Steroidobacteraceae bacterium]
MSLNIALTGLNAANEDLSVTSNNLANVATTGFKGSRTEFADLFASTQQGAIATGNGVDVAEVAQQFTQGNIETTGNTLDMAVSGNGFFIVSNNGALNYTRDGEFQLNSSGQVVTASGQLLQGYPPLANGTFNTGGLAAITLTTNESQPKATSTAQITANLPAGATPPADAPFSATDPNSYNNTTSLTVYDSLGAAHTASLYFINTAPNAWEAQLTVDGTTVGAPQPLTYSQTGQLLTPANGQVAFPAYTPATGAAAMNMTFNFSNTTQYGGNFGVTAVQQNGYTTGQLTGINISQTGVVQAQFTNGNSVNLGQVALATFANSQGLQQLGNASWSATNASGAAVNGVAGNSGFGNIQSGSLEHSNVDTTAALVDMITAQRDFQANAQMIQTEDQVTQSIINIRG